jgi:hypothetical protein
MNKLSSLAQLFTNARFAFLLAGSLALVGCSPSIEAVERPDATIGLADGSAVSDAGPLSDSGSVDDARVQFPPKPVKTCDIRMPFVSLQRIPGLKPNSPVQYSDLGVVPSPDELTLYFGSSRVGNGDFFFTEARRAHVDEPFAVSRLLSFSSGLTQVVNLHVFRGQRVAYYQAVTRGDANMMVPSRTLLGRARIDNQGNFVDQETALDISGISVTSRRLYLTSPGSELISILARDDDKPLPPRSVGTIPTPNGRPANPVVSEDENVVYYTTRVGGVGQAWIMQRTAAGMPFETPKAILSGVIAGKTTERDFTPSWASPDGCRLYLSALIEETPMNPQWRLYVASR